MATTANRRLGFGFVKPTGWQFEALKDFGSLMEGQVLSGLDEATQQEILEENASTLMVAISKYDLSATRFGPTITVFLNTEQEHLKRANFAEFVSDAIDGFSAVLTDYEVTEAPSKLQLSNCLCTRFKARFLLK